MFVTRPFNDVTKAGDISNRQLSNARDAASGVLSDVDFEESDDGIALTITMHRPSAHYTLRRFGVVRGPGVRYNEPFASSSGRQAGTSLSKRRLHCRPPHHPPPFTSRLHSQSSLRPPEQVRFVRVTTRTHTYMCACAHAYTHGRIASISQCLCTAVDLPLSSPRRRP